MRLTKRDVEALLAPLHDDDIAALVDALTVALRTCLDAPGAPLRALVVQCGLPAARKRAVLSLDPPALWDLATEVAERREAPPPEV